MSVQQEKFKAIADRIRIYLLTEEPIKPNDFADKIGEVYNRGDEDGYLQGIYVGIEEGKAEGIEQGRAEAENEMFNYGMSLSEALTSGDSNVNGLEANINQAKSDITAIKTLIENHGVEVPIGTLSSTYDETLEKIISGNYQLGYDTGGREGYSSGLNAGIEQGKQSAYDEFWDVITNKGERNMCQYMFFCWDSEYIRPNRKIVPTYFESGACVFNRCTNLKKVEADYFDFSQKQRGTSHSSGWYYMFYNCPNIEEIEDIGLSPQYSYGHTFNGCTKLHTIARIRVDEDTLFESTFGKCNALKNIVIEGVVGNNIDFQYSPLSKESIMGKPITEEEFMELSDDVKANNVFVHNGSYYYGGVVTALSSTTTGKTLILKKSAVNSAFVIDVDDESTYPEGSEFYALRHSKDNWTFTYA